MQLDNYRGQCYDGVGNMKGCRSGVATHIMSDENLELSILTAMGMPLTLHVKIQSVALKLDLRNFEVAEILFKTKS